MTKSKAVELTQADIRSYERGEKKLRDRANSRPLFFKPNPHPKWVGDYDLAMRGCPDCP